MDTIESYSRLRTERQRKRTARTDKDKKLIRLYKEERQLRKQKWELPMIDLIPPVQKGWKRYFVVREDVRRSKDGVFYENLLEKINTTNYNDTKDFKVRKKKKGRWEYEIKEQKLRWFYPDEIKRQKFTDRELACFEFKMTLKVENKKIRQVFHYEMIEPWRYVLRIRPNIITKVKAHDSELEQRIAELNKTVDEYHNRGRLCKVLCREGWRHYDKSFKYTNPLKNIPKQQIEERFY